MNTVELINQRADLHEAEMDARFKHDNHPNSFTHGLWALAVRNLKQFDARIEAELKRLRDLKRTL